MWYNSSISDYLMSRLKKTVVNINFKQLFKF